MADIEITSNFLWWLTHDPYATSMEAWCRDDMADEGENSLAASLTWEFLEARLPVGYRLITAGSGTLIADLDAPEPPHNWADVLRDDLSQFNVWDDVQERLYMPPLDVSSMGSTLGDPATVAELGERLRMSNNPQVMATMGVHQPTVAQGNQDPGLAVRADMLRLVMAQRIARWNQDTPAPETDQRGVGYPDGDLRDVLGHVCQAVTTARGDLDCLENTPLGDATAVTIWMMGARGQAEEIDDVPAIYGSDRRIAAIATASTPEDVFEALAPGHDAADLWTVPFYGLNLSLGVTGTSPADNLVRATLAKRLHAWQTEHLEGLPVETREAAELPLLPAVIASSGNVRLPYMDDVALQRSLTPIRGPFPGGWGQLVRRQAIQNAENPVVTVPEPPLVACLRCELAPQITALGEDAVPPEPDEVIAAAARCAEDPYGPVRDIWDQKYAPFVDRDTVMQAHAMIGWEWAAATPGAVLEAQRIRGDALGFLGDAQAANENDQSLAAADFWNRREADAVEPGWLGPCPTDDVVCPMGPEL